MLSQRILFSLLLLAIIFSCKTQEGLSPKKLKTLQTVSSSVFDNTLSEFYILDTAYQEKDALVLEVRHNILEDSLRFDLKWTGSVRKSYPPQASLLLDMKGNSGQKADTVSQKLYFNIDEISEYAPEVRIYFMNDERSFIYKWKEKS